MVEHRIGTEPLQGPIDWRQSIVMPFLFPFRRVLPHMRLDANFAEGVVREMGLLVFVGRRFQNQGPFG